MDIITPDTRSGFGRRGEERSGHHFRQPSAGWEVLWNWNIHSLHYIHKWMYVCGKRCGLISYSVCSRNRILLGIYVAVCYGIVKSVESPSCPIWSCL